MKKITFILLVILLSLLGMLLIGCKEKAEKNDIEGYTFARRGDEYAIIGYTGNKLELTLPSEYQGKPITTIGESAFYQSVATRIHVSNSIKTIADNAFAAASSLSHVSVPESVTTIGDNVFAECWSLIEIVVSEDNSRFKSIDGHLYNKNATILMAYSMGKGEEEFYLPETVQKINPYVFYLSFYLNDLYLPEVLNEIGELAFVGSSIKNFYVEEGNETFSTVDGVLYTDEMKTLYAFPPQKEIDENDYTVPETVKKIHQDAFAYTGIEKYILSEGVEEIGDRAFLKSNIRDISIPSTVKNIGEAIFQECGYLLNISVSIHNSHYQDIGGNLYNKSGTIFMHYALGKQSLFFEIQSGVTEIAEYAFYKTAHLQEIELPSTIAKIGEAALNSNTLIVIVFNSNLPPIIEEATIGRNRSDLVIYVPDNQAETYKEHNDIWEMFQNTIKEFSER